jgi:predicted RND superfamily exporter protein
MIQKRGKELFPNAKILLIGSISQFTVMQDYITWGQLKSFFIALVVIAILMSVVFGSIKTGLIGMIPNVAPALAVGGLMGFADIPLDMMTVTVIPMLLGLAVDDTIHFINHSQLEFIRTKSYVESTRRVFISVGTALFLTSLVLILCFSAYLISAANVFVNMGILVAMGIIAALTADYFVTPVLLKWVQPFGEEKKQFEHLQTAQPLLSNTTLLVEKSNHKNLSLSNKVSSAKSRNDESPIDFISKSR